MMCEERFINDRLYRISRRADGRYQAIGCETYNAIVSTVYIETDEIHIFDRLEELRQFLTDINGGRRVYL